MTGLHRPGVLRGDVFVDEATLLERSARAASALRSLGVCAGDAVALLLRNDHAFFEASYGAGMLDAAAVPVNWHGSAEEIRFVVEDCGAKVLVAHSDLLAGVGPSLPPEVAVRVVPTPPDVLAACGVDRSAPSEPRGHPAWEEWILGFPPVEDRALPLGVSMIYTSGTTGRPKGVRRQLPPRGAGAPVGERPPPASAGGLTTGMRTVVTGPMYHSAPNWYALTAARTGGFLVLQPRFDAEELLAVVERHRITHLQLVPTMFVRLLRLPPEVRARFDLSSLTHVVHTAAPCPIDVKRRMIEWLGPIVHEFYGGTETGSVTACTSDEWLRHPGTVGRPVEGAIIRILGDDGRALPAGTPGEVYMRNHAVPDFTYQGRADARLEVERDGLITCGDIGYLDDEGYLYLCDRKRDMVISGGVNVYPAEIEACLLRLDAVRDCAVFGAPDDEYGEHLVAAIELEPGTRLDPDSVRAFVREHLAPFKAPKVVTFHTALPREDSGKIFKRRLREPYWARAGRNI